jgi:hypothetical protein
VSPNLPVTSLLFGLIDNPDLPATMPPLQLWREYSEECDKVSTIHARLQQQEVQYSKASAWKFQPIRNLRTTLRAVELSRVKRACRPPRLWV